MQHNGHRGFPLHVRSSCLLGLLITAGLAPQGTAHARGKYDFADLKALQQAFVKLAEDVRPSVTAIRTYSLPRRQRSSRLLRHPYSQGSGFVLSADGFIGTNFHVIDGSDVITVILSDGSIHEAEVVSTDRRRDLAVLKIDAANLTPVRFGDAKRLKPNMWTFACGNPFGLANTHGNTSVSYGAITAIGRDMTVPLVENSLIEYYGNLLETSSAINPGNSGGPLFNIDGEIIGIVTAIETSSGVNEGTGFAIPINANTIRILETLRKGEQMRYGFLGVEIQDVSRALSRTVAISPSVRGALVTGISPPDGPAAKAGLKPGDIVLYVDGQAVNSSDELVRIIQYMPVGRQIEITYLRKRVQRKSTVTLGDRQSLITSPGE